MNVIVANKYQLLLENLGIDIIKEINGEFSADEIISTFQNFFYQRMILDITAIKDYKDIKNLQKLSISLNMEKVILLLDGTEETSNPTFISQLISMGIYNFARDVDGIQYLYNNPNSYRDVAQYHQLQNQALQQQQQKNIQNNTLKQYENVASYNSIVPENNIKVIGVKNVTKHAGSTSLIYSLKNVLSKKYKVVAIEVDKMDFAYFRDKLMVSTVSPNFLSELNKYNSYDVILVDLNNSVTAEGLCQMILYLVEPTTIKINRLMTISPSYLRNLKGKKTILNQSLLSSSELSEFEYEAKIKAFYNMPPINERDKNNQFVIDFLTKLGFTI